MKEKPQKLRKLTKKQRGFVKDYLESENGRQAALKNYDIESKNAGEVAAVIATENLIKPNVALAIEQGRKSVRFAMEEQGITAHKIAQKIDVLLEAKDEKGLTDYTAVDKGLKHATNIYGITDPENDKPKGNSTYNFIFSAETQADVRAMEEKLKARLIKHVSTS